MKILNIILIATILILLIVGISHAVYTISLTDLRMENMQIFRQDVVINQQTGETEEQMKLSMNYTLFDSSGNTKGMNVEFTLTAQERTDLLAIIKPYVTKQATAHVVVAPAWTK